MAASAAIQEVEPIETFDIIVTDERHHSIYHLSPQVLEQFEPDLIGLTATPNEHAFGFCAHKPTGPPIRQLAMRPESASAGGTADKVWRYNTTSGNCAALAQSTMEDRSRLFWYQQDVAFFSRSVPERLTYRMQVEWEWSHVDD